MWSDGEEPGRQEGKDVRLETLLAARALRTARHLSLLRRARRGLTRDVIFGKQ